MREVLMEGRIDVGGAVVRVKAEVGTREDPRRFGGGVVVVESVHEEFCRQVAGAPDDVLIEAEAGILKVFVVDSPWIFGQRQFCHGQNWNGRPPKSETEDDVVGPEPDTLALGHEVLVEEGLHLEQRAPREDRRLGPGESICAEIATGPPPILRKA